MSEINVRDYISNRAEKRTLDVGSIVFVPYRIVEINAKQTGNTVLKQYKLDGPSISPSKETYTEHKLREVFEAV